MANEYGVSASTLGKWFPSAIPFASSARVDSALIASVVTSVAIDIQSALYPSVPNDSHIGTHNAPIAYAWLAKTLELGVVIRLMETTDTGDSATLDAWRGEFTERMSTLRNRPKTVLADVGNFQQASRTVSLWR